MTQYLKKKTSSLNLNPHPLHAPSAIEAANDAAVASKSEDLIAKVRRAVEQQVPPFLIFLLPTL